MSKTEHTLSCPESPPLTISGAMYSIVPQKEYALSPLNKQTKQKEIKQKGVWFQASMTSDRKRKILRVSGWDGTTVARWW